MWEVLGCLGASVDDLEPLSGPMWAVLGRSWGLVGDLGPLLDPRWAVLGCSWGHCRGGPGPLLGPTYVGGPGPLLGPMLAVLAALGASVSGPGQYRAGK